MTRHRLGGPWQHPKKSRLRWLKWPVGVACAFLLLSVGVVLPLRWQPPPTTAFMLQDQSGRVPVLYEWADWSAISDAAALAVVAAEDQRFAEHFGLDLEAIADSIEAAESGGRLRGASTISQQLVKNLYLWPGRNCLRKGLEAWLTLVTEVCLSKKRILELYLNVIELGPGIYGVGAASRFYFDKSPSALSRSEAALLASVLPNPASLRVDRPSGYVRERQRWIMGQMQRLDRESWLLRL